VAVAVAEFGKMFLQEREEIRAADYNGKKIKPQC
jgi:hypothetical protein